MCRFRNVLCCTRWISSSIRCFIVILLIMLVIWLGSGGGVGAAIIDSDENIERPGSAMTVSKM